MINECEWSGGTPQKFSLKFSMTLQYQLSYLPAFLHSAHDTDSLGPTATLILLTPLMLTSCTLQSHSFLKLSQDITRISILIYYSLQPAASPDPPGPNTAI